MTISETFVVGNITINLHSCPNGEHDVLMEIRANNGMLTRAVDFQHLLILAEELPKKLAKFQEAFDKVKSL